MNLFIYSLPSFEIAWKGNEHYLGKNCLFF